MALWKKNILLIAVTIAIVVAPLIFVKDAEFAGADGLAGDAIAEIAPDYEPWFNSLFEPASGEIESLLFASQAALGAGVCGFILGRMTAKKPSGEQDDTNR